MISVESWKQNENELSRIGLYHMCSLSRVLITVNHYYDEE